jgi:hypothetical protein
MNAKMICQAVFLIAIVVITAGCPSSGSSSSGGTSMDQLAKEVDSQSAAKKQQDAAAVAKTAADQKAAADATAAKAAEQEKKAVGSRPQPTTGGYYGAIMGARRHVMNVVDNISWIQGVKNFQGTYGRNPKDTKEFMNVCVKENDLQLPHIEADEEYVYDPNGESAGNFGQLFVVKKESPGSAPPAAAPPPAAPGTAPPAAPGATQ